MTEQYKFLKMHSYILPRTILRYILFPTLSNQANQIINVLIKCIKWQSWHFPLQLCYLTFNKLDYTEYYNIRGRNKIEIGQPWEESLIFFYYKKPACPFVFLCVCVCVCYHFFETRIQNNQKNKKNKQAEAEVVPSSSSVKFKFLKFS